MTQHEYISLVIIGFIAVVGLTVPSFLFGWETRNYFLRHPRTASKVFKSEEEWLAAETGEPTKEPAPTSQGASKSNMEAGAVGEQSRNLPDTLLNNVS